MGTSLPLLIHRMKYGEFDLICLIIGVVVGILIIIALMYRLCCYKKGVLPNETAEIHNL